MTAQDAYTLELKLPGPLPHIFTLLLNVVVTDPLSNLAQSAGGTGPFKLDALRPGDETRLIRHTECWRAGRMYLDAVTIRAAPVGGSLLAALEYVS